MAERKIRRYDIDLTSQILFLFVFCVLALVFTFAKGSDVMYYAGFPMLITAIFAAFAVFCTEGFVAGQVQRRIQWRKAQNALAVYHSVQTVNLVQGVVVFVLFYVCSGWMGRSLFGSALIVPVLCSFAPTMILTGFLGCMIGFLRGIGQKRYARMALWMVTLLSVLLGLGGGFYCAYHGEKVGALLQNEDISAVYCGCGMAAGFTLACLITFLFVAVLCHLGVRRLRPRQSRREAFLADTQRTENRGFLMRYYVQKTYPGLVLLLLILTGLLISYRFWLSHQNPAQTSINASVWGSYMGLSLPMAAGCGLLLALPFTALTARLLRDHAKGNTRALHTRLSMLLRLSGYVSIPCAAFLFSAAKEIVELFPHLTFKGQTSAIMSLKAGCFLSFFLQEGVLMLYFTWHAMSRRRIAASAAAGFFIQIIAVIVLDMFGDARTMTAWAMDVFWLVFLILLYLFAKGSVLKRMSGSWITEDALIAVCAFIAAIPIEFLNDYLVEVMPAVPALLIAFVIYTVLYVMLSIFLRAADLRNMERIPGGGVIISLAILLGIAGSVEE